MLDYLQFAFWVIVVAGTVFYLTKSIKRLLQVAGGLAMLGIYNNIWDIGVWPIIQGIFGIYGVVGLTLMALILNFGVLWWYQTYCTTDWLGLSLAEDIVTKSKELQENRLQGSGFNYYSNTFLLGGFRIAEKAIAIKWIPFLVLSLFVDSFMATAFHLRGKKYEDGKIMKKADYGLFLLSTIISCVAWSVFTEFVTLPAFKNLWQFVPL